MVICQDCIHYDVCQYHITEETSFTINECGKFLNNTNVVEIKHSYWEDEKGNYVGFAKDGCPEKSCQCHNCKEWLVASDEYACVGNYCPNCGAKMDLVGD